MILSATCGIEPKGVIAYKPLLDSAIEQARHAPEAVILLARPQCEAGLAEGRDHDWIAVTDAAKAALDGGRDQPCVPVKATDPLYVIYTSGSTGKPKGVVRDNGGHAVALRWTMDALFGFKPGDTMFCASDVGWVVGHCYIVYAPLFAGCTSVLYEGKPVGTPDAGA